MSTAAIKMLFDFFLPPRCFACDAPAESDSLCASCLSLCCPAQNPLFGQEERIGAVFYYEQAVRNLIMAGKFFKQAAEARLIVTLAKQQILRSELWHKLLQIKPSAITYIPSSLPQTITRGYDIPLLFAIMLGQLLEKPVVHLLKKHPRPQLSTLQNKKERMAVVAGSFGLRSHEKFQSLLVVDDITTTGSTFRESLKTLRPICQSASCLSIAKTP
jgi:predicted amidophosphoribosyltransferase